jgi:hypothetical protein
MAKNFKRQGKKCIIGELRTYFNKGQCAIEKFGLFIVFERFGTKIVQAFEIPFVLETRIVRQYYFLKW